MKRKIIIMTILLCAATVIAVADERPTTIDKLPKKAQEFVGKYFKTDKVAYATVDKDILETTYEVAFASAAKVEFNSSGEWKEVDCRTMALPAGIVPTQIVAKVKELYPEATINAIDKGKFDYDVKLNNRLELTFDRNFNLVEIDD